MFNSTVLDVIIGLIFGFLTVSVVTSAIVEAFSSALKWRATTLLAGIKNLVNDPDFSALALQLYQHASINPLGPGIAKAAAITDEEDDVDTNENAEEMKAAKKAAKIRLPSYIDSMQFANALLDVTGLSSASTNLTQGQKKMETLLQAIEATPAEINKIQNPQINQFLTGIIQRAGGDLEQVRAALAQWFDSAMDRVSGEYKRKTQLYSFVIALGLSVAINVDSIRIARGMWEQPTISDRLKIPPVAQQAGSNSGESEESKEAKALLQVLGDNLPVGWPSGIPLEVKDETKNKR